MPERIIGRVTSFTRDGKTIKADNKLYKLYVYLWCAPWPIRFALLWIRNQYWKIRNKETEDGKAE